MRISDWSSDVCSSDLLQHPHHLVGGLRHLVEIVAVELDRHVAADARDQFVEPQLNGLADFVKLSELTASSLLDAFNHVSLGRACGPLVLRFQDDERSEEHTSELQSIMRISYAVFCLKKKN